MNINKILTEQLDITPKQTETVIQLIDEGNTIPFIARYRKDWTGNMNDEQLRLFDERLRYLRNLEDRKKTVISAIEEQGKMTDELFRRIDAAETAVQVEDLYRPYKQKRRTRAVIAKEKGVSGLAKYILAHPEGTGVTDEAAKYLSEEKEVKTVPDAIHYAQDIIAGCLSDNAEYREQIRKRTRQQGVVASVATKEGADDPTYANYADFSEPVDKIPGHRILAMNRGEKEKKLTVRINAPEESCIGYLSKKVGTGEYLTPAVEDAYKRLIEPSVETEVRSELSEKAEEGAIKIFGKNLEQLLMQPPLTGKTVLGWDPAFRTGCKLAVCDPTGKILATTVIFPTEPQNKVAESKKVLTKLADKYHIDVISVGNGTASRESEQIIAEFIREYAAAQGRTIQYVIVNEAGASVYSASKLATEEYPDLDVGERSSASIARRLQDPLSELVKIDPKSIGVGQYQHDMNQKKLGEALNGVVEDCVNRVGVDLNTASPSLLEYVSGISKTVAKNIVAYRDANGRFRSRKELLKVAKLGPKAYEQCAGFLRIHGGTEALDATAVHPESYDAARKILARLGYTEADLAAGGVQGLSARMKLQSKFGGRGEHGGIAALAKDVGIGEYTLRDILEELEKPGRDPRSEAAAPILRSDVLEMSDLKPGMELKGTVRNIVDFGAFVDIGVHQDGLVHISELSDRYVRHPLDVVRVGDIVNVRVLSVDVKRKRIALSMKKKSER